MRGGTTPQDAEGSAAGRSEIGGTNGGTGSTDTARSGTISAGMTSA